MFSRAGETALLAAISASLPLGEQPMTRGKGGLVRQIKKGDFIARQHAADF